MIWVDRDNLAQPPEQADERVGGDHAPVGPAQLTVAKRRGNHLRVEVTEVIGDEHERLLFRQVNEPFDPQAKPGPHQHPVERIERGGASVSVRRSVREESSRFGRNRIDAGFCY